MPAEEKGPGGFASIGRSTLLSPVPAVILSCRAGGRDNLITVAWTGTVCSEPPMLSVSIRPERCSYGMIRETGAFCVNLVSTRMVRAADYCGVRSGRDVDKYAETGLHPWEWPDFPVPGVREAPACLLCRVRERLPLGSHDLFLCEVFDTRVRQDLLDGKGGLHMERASLAAYAHGQYYPLEEKPMGFFGYSVARPQVLRRRLRRD